MSEIRNAVYCGRELFLAGINNGTNGNLSFRSGDKIYISRSGSVMSELKKSDFVKIDNPRASSESPSHAAVYSHSENIGAVLHTHPSAVIAFSLLSKKKFIKPADLEGSLYFPALFIIDTVKTPSAPDLPGKIIKHIDSGGVIIRGHGVFTFGKDIKDAYLKTLTINNICSIALSSGNK